MRRTWRLWLPITLVLTLFAVTATAYAIEEPNPRDEAFLSPVSRAGTGAATLADRLRARGVQIDRRTDVDEARRAAAAAGSATLFVPAPDLLHTDFLRQFGLLPPSVRVVLVRPSAETLDRAGLDAGVTGSRIAAKAVPAGCDVPLAGRGPAAAFRTRYAADGVRPAFECYRGGLLGVRWAVASAVLVGAADPFRNDRIDEHANSALAVALLSEKPRLVWVDVHGPQDPPEPDDGGGLPSGTRPPPTDYEPGGGGPPPGGGGQGEGEGEGQGEAEDDSSVFDLFPPVAWFTLLLLLAAAVLIALARARRLGTPVAEPLPVTVRATETVTGRGRLYERSRDRAAALSILRASARERLADLLSLPADTGRADLVATVAAYLRTDPRRIDDALYGAEPDDDEALVRTAAAVDALLHDVTAPRHEGERP